MAFQLLNEIVVALFGSKVSSSKDSFIIIFIINPGILLQLDIFNTNL